MIDISIIIVSYNTRDYLRGCLQSLQTDPNVPSHEVFVVDNGSRDDSVAMLRSEFADVRVIETGQNLGFARANNLALRQMRGRTALLLNSDTVVTPGALSAMLNALNAHPEAAAIGPRLLNRDGSLQPSCYKFPAPGRALCDQLFITTLLAHHPRWGDYRRWTHDQTQAVDFVIGAALLVRADILPEIGLLDEDFFMYAEETDWCYRMQLAGYQVLFTPDAEIIHYGGGSGKAMPDRVFVEASLGQRRFYRKHYGKSGALALRVSLVLGAVLRIPLFSLLGIISPARRINSWAIVRLWVNILRWNLGLWNAPGLAPTAQTGALSHA
jgi:GT2 family glycosyltransferase